MKRVLACILAAALLLGCALAEPEAPETPAPEPEQLIETPKAEPEEAPEAPLEDASPGTLMDKGETELAGSASEESQETTTSTIITTTVITTEQAPGRQPPAPPALQQL